jgi:serine/threonine-protein kinase
MINTIIKDYHIHSELGRGGMAIVYLAHDNKFDTNVAVKVLNKEFVNNENIRKRFLAEARNMFKMSHPNIIKVTYLIEEGDNVAMVMEYIEGQTLKEYLDRKGKLSDTEIKNLFSQMLDAVGYVHEQNLIHRDIKPSNFMLDKKGKIKLMDFGIAKNMDATSSDYTNTGTTQNLGTPMYMSPEQIKSTKDVTLQSDIYSLGVVLWQMVTGKKPYDIKTLSTFELQTKIVNEALLPSNTVFDALISLATQKELTNRIKTCEEFKIKLEKINNNLKNIPVSIETTVLVDTPKVNNKVTLINEDNETVMKVSKSSSSNVTVNVNTTSSSNQSKKTQPTNPPENNIVWAILCAVLCCLPLGIVAIIKSSSVNTLWAQDNYEAAQKAADDAKKYSIWGAAITGIFVILCFLLQLL